MLGKYSPTVSNSYRQNPEWFRRYSKGENFDPEGFDSYGYNESGVDREGNHEYVYCGDEALYYSTLWRWDAYEKILGKN